MLLKTSPLLNPQFANDVLQGLTSTPKSLPSKYFYDENGDRLFQRIMAMPEYYLTKCELEILKQNKAKLLRDFGENEPFDLIELGAGDATKTKILLRHFSKAGAGFQYFPIDISGDVLQHLEKELHEELPDLSVKPKQGEYLKSLRQIPHRQGVRKIVLFLGSSIGNMNMKEAGDFLKKVAAELQPGDLMLTGFDLKKDPQIILDAYDDSAGITRDFNLNLLARINRELGGHFDLNNFRHWETYDPMTGETKSYLVSTERQKVEIEALDTTIAFEKWEPVFTELSQKFSLTDIRNLAQAAGFRMVKNYTDEKEYFVDSLWRVRMKG